MITNLRNSELEQVEDLKKKWLSGQKDNDRQRKVRGLWLKSEELCEPRPRQK